ncbi:MAG: class I SAM-dependent methyltransferase [Leptospirales bacterium]
MKDDIVSSTAFTVAQGILLVSRKTKVNTLVSEIEKIFYREILKSSNSGRKKLKQVQNPVFRFIVPFIEKLMIPGLTIHYALRKKAIEKFTRSALKSGAKQIINLGAGFDSLAYRLGIEYPEVNLIEIDHPATHKVKKDALQAMEQIPKNLHMLDIDFNKDSLENGLQEFAHFDSKLQTIYIIEGVLMYLDEEKITTLFNAMKAVSKNGFRLIFTFITPDGEGKYTHGPLLGLYLKIKNEPLNWKINYENLKKFMSRNNIPLLSVVKSEEILKELMPEVSGMVVHDGEMIACAEYKK